MILPCQDRKGPRITGGLFAGLRWLDSLGKAAFPEGHSQPETVMTKAIFTLTALALLTATAACQKVEKPEPVILGS